MALTRSMLKEMNLTEEQVEKIINEHKNTVDGLKEQRDEYEKERDTFKIERDKFKKDSEKLAETKKELDELKKDHVSAEDWKEKYEAKDKELTEYKAEIAGKETEAKLQEAYKKLLVECKIGEKHIPSILKVTNVKNLKLNDNGEFENVDDLKKEIEADYSGFISSTGTKGADVETPPAGGKGGEGNSRAAELAKKYRENLYGKEAKEE